jgi:hypothetical protein
MSKALESNFKLSFARETLLMSFSFAVFAFVLETESLGLLKAEDSLIT